MDLGSNTLEEVGGGPATQDNHELAIDSELGKDVLLLTAVEGTDAVSRGYVYTADVLTMANDDDVRSLLGKRVTMWLRNATPTERRPLHGQIRLLNRGSLDSRGYRHWQAEVVPWLWFLTQTSDCRIYQNLSIPDILRSVFDERGFSDYQLRLVSAYPERLFTVQYRESAFTFVSRLMEHVGLFYWFEHAADRHLLVVSDSNWMGPVMAGAAVSFSNRADLGDVQELSHHVRIRPGGWAMNDFDFEVPKKKLESHQSTLLPPHPLSRFEKFDYPGLYTAIDDGTRLARIRMEEEEASHFEIAGAGSRASFDPGKRISLGAEHRGDKAANFFVTRVRHTARDERYHSGAEAPTHYANEFTAIPVDTNFRPQRLTPKPFVQGPQTATVVGPPGETIYTDSYGRVRLQFHWDRRGTNDEKSSCWVRVSQNSAGPGWGGMFIPHVGHEVIVSFLEGDPDQPIVTGRVYNGDNQKSVSLPANKTQTGLRDHSGNEIQLEGKAGVQDFRMTAVKDMNVSVQHDYSETVQTGDRTIQVAAGKHTETIKGDTKITVTAGSLTVVVAANAATYQSKATTAILSANADVHVQASTQIALDVGESHLLLKKDGTIQLSGKNVIIQGTDSVTIQGNAIRSIADQENETKGAITVSEGVTTNTVKGGMVMLNPGS